MESINSKSFLEKAITLYSITCNFSKKVCLFLSLGFVYAPAFAGVGIGEKGEKKIVGLKKKIEKEGILQKLDSEHVNSGEEKVEHRKLVGTESFPHLFDMDTWYGCFSLPRNEEDNSHKYSDILKEQLAGFVRVKSDKTGRDIFKSCASHDDLAISLSMAISEAIKHDSLDLPPIY